MRELNKQEILEKSFIHMINAAVGRGIKDSSIIPAKDILGFGLGIDSLGDRHMRLKLNPTVIENMKKIQIIVQDYLVKILTVILKHQRKKKLKHFILMIQA